MGKREKLSQLTRSLSAIPVESLTLSSDFPAKSRSFIVVRAFRSNLQLSCLSISPACTVCHSVTLFFFTKSKDSVFFFTTKHELRSKSVACLLFFTGF